MSQDERTQVREQYPVSEVAVAVGVTKRALTKRVRRWLRRHPSYERFKGFVPVKLVKAWAPGLLEKK